MNWRVIVAVVVALIIGAGAGAFGEHQRLKHDSNKKSSSSSHKTTTTKKGAKTSPVTADWFGAQRTAACPALKSWNTAAVASYTALYQKTPWATTKVKLTGESDTMKAAFVTMERYANAAGKTELAAQITYQTKAKSALATAASVADYLKATKPLNTAKLKQGGAVLSAAVKKCA